MCIEVREGGSAQVVDERFFPWLFKWGWGGFGVIRFLAGGSVRPVGAVFFACAYSFQTHKAKIDLGVIRNKALIRTLIYHLNIGYGRIFPCR